MKLPRILRVRATVTFDPLMTPTEQCVIKVAMGAKSFLAGVGAAVLISELVRWLA